MVNTLQNHLGKLGSEGTYGVITKVPNPFLCIIPSGGSCIAIVSFSGTETIFSFISRGSTGQQLSFSGASAGTLAAKFI